MGELLPLGTRPRTVEPLLRHVVGHVLRTTRTDQDRTLADVATVAGISVQYLSEVERGRKEPSSEVLAAVAGALGLRLVDLTARVHRDLLAHRKVIVDLTGVTSGSTVDLARRGTATPRDGQVLLAA